MSKTLLLKPPHGRLRALNHSSGRRNPSTLVFSSSPSKPPLSSLLHLSPSLPPLSSRLPSLCWFSFPAHVRTFPVRALESSSAARTDNEGKEESKAAGEDDGAPLPSPPNAAASGSDDRALVEKAGSDGGLPAGEFEMDDFGWWKNFVVKLRMLFAFPWERIKKGSVLSMKLRS